MKALSQATPLVLLDVTDHIATLTLNRPEQLNALTPALSAELTAALAECSDNAQVEALVLAANGSAFCAGGDVTEMARADDRSAYMTALVDGAHKVIERLLTLEFPVIAAVNGVVAGGGLGLIGASDVVVASNSARFVMAYQDLGVTPDCGTSFLLPQRVGHARALEMALTNRMVDAETALAWGLVSRVVPGPSLAHEVKDLALPFASGLGRIAGRTRSLIRGSVDGPASRLSSEAASIVDLITGPVASARLQKYAR